jgi:CRISPR-associated exonuclease Cas4
MEGHLLHDRVHEQETEGRGQVRIARGLRLRSLQLGLAGISDVVEFHRIENATEGAHLPGVNGLWRPFPVEYKRGVQREEASFEVQLCAQAMCLEEMLGVAVPAGTLFYGLSRRRHDVTFDCRLRFVTQEVARGLHELIAAGRTPAPVYGPKCKRCSLLHVCMPKLMTRRAAVGAYLAGALRAAEER